MRLATDLLGLPAMSHPIRRAMTSTPHSVGADQSLAVAHRMMNTHHLRHLPVLDGGRIVGVVSQRDLYFIETLKDVDPETTHVSEAMAEDVYSVEPDAELALVARTMAERKLGCAVIVEKGKTIGVFTTTDALRALAASLGS
jgi:acetoin utilization protein AcuB